MIADDVKGWLGEGEGEALRDLAAACSGPALEIGSYCGKSAVWIGSALRDRGEVLFTIDHHRGSPEMAPGADCHDPDLIGPDGHDSLPFLRRTLHAYGLEDTVVPVVGASEVVGRYWRLPVGFGFIDAGHAVVPVTRDVGLFAQWVTQTLVLHDATIEHIGRLGDVLVHDGWQDGGMVGCMRVLHQ